MRTNEIEIRVLGEQPALWLSIAVSFLAAIFLFSISFGVALVIAAIGLIYVRIRQGQILGSSLLLTKNANIDIHAYFEQALAVFPHLNVRCHLVQSPVLNAFALGFSPPYTIVAHSAIRDALSPDEMRFILGHEIGHVFLGHTQVLSLIAPFGNTLPGLNLLFGFWQRKAELSADRAGLLACESIEAAISALAKVTCGPTAINRQTVESLLAQAKSVDESIPDKFSELFGTHPFLTNRIKKLLEFNREMGWQQAKEMHRREIVCENCGKLLRFPDSDNSLRLTCPICKNSFIVPGRRS